MDGEGDSQGTSTAAVCFTFNIGFPSSQSHSFAHRTVNFVVERVRNSKRESLIIFRRRLRRGGSIIGVSFSYFFVEKSPNPYNILVSLNGRKDLKPYYSRKEHYLIPTINSDFNWHQSGRAKKTEKFRLSLRMDLTRSFSTRLHCILLSSGCWPTPTTTIIKNLG